MKMKFIKNEIFIKDLKIIFLCGKTKEKYVFGGYNHNVTNNFMDKETVNSKRLDQKKSLKKYFFGL